MIYCIIGDIHFWRIAEGKNFKVTEGSLGNVQRNRQQSYPSMSITHVVISK